MSSFEIQYLVTQYGLVILQAGLLFVTIFFYRQLVKNDNSREVKASEQEIKKWCKAVFRGVDSPGALQRAGEKTRARFPRRINLILQAYDELTVEEPSRDRPALYEFLEAMDGVERGEWPHAVEAMSGRLKIYNE